jgi:hypothetical protein
VWILRSMVTLEFNTLTYYCSHPSVRPSIHPYTAYIYTYVRTYRYICIRIYTHAYIRIFINTYIHIYIQTYIHTYIHTYVHTLSHASSFFFLRLCSPARAMASSSTRFLDHTQRRATVRRHPLDEWSARRRDLYLTTPHTPSTPACHRWDSNPRSQ